MKNFFQIISLIVVALFVAVSCQRNSQNETFVSQKDNLIFAADSPVVSAKKEGFTEICNPDVYAVKLESRTYVNGSWEWVWSVQNTNPGNGNNGTAQDLSNWGMELGACVDWSTVTGAAYSSDGVTWKSFNPSYQVNPGQGCITTPVLKFDFGTSGSSKSYYRLIVSQDYTESATVGYYKSGSKTSCCTFSFTGIGCGGPEEIAE